MQIDVVIPAYGRADLLEKCLGFLGGQQDVETHLIVVDDTTPDKEESAKIAELTRAHNGKYWLNKTNMGFPRTANKGASKGYSPLIVFLNTDVFLDAGALKVMHDEFADPDVGVVGPMLVFPEESQWGTPGKIQHVGVAINIKGTPLHPFVGWDVTNERAVQRRDFLQAVTGACIMTRRSLWSSIGGFADVYGRGTYEDIEYCIAARSHGKKIVCNPAARGIHYVGQSAMKEGGYPLQQNSKIFMQRVGPYLLHDEYLIW